MLCKTHTFQCMGKIFCVKFQRVPLKFHTKYLTHTLKNVDFIHKWKFMSSLISVFEMPPVSVENMQCGRPPWLSILKHEQENLRLFFLIYQFDNLLQNLLTGSVSKHFVIFSTNASACTPTCNLCPMSRRLRQTPHQRQRWLLIGWAHLQVTHTQCIVISTRGYQYMTICKNRICELYYSVQEISQLIQYTKLWCKNKNCPAGNGLCAVLLQNLEFSAPGIQHHFFFVLQCIRHCFILRLHWLS